MPGVFRNIDPPPPHRTASVYPPAFGAGGGHTRWVEGGGGVNSLEDARHCSVLYICKYFVLYSILVHEPGELKRFHTFLHIFPSPQGCQARHSRWGEVLLYADRGV
jgi:hypothetical protein